MNLGFLRPMRATLCVFAKPPRLGAVKTRLVPAVGERGAVELAHAFLADTWQAARAIPWARAILATTELDATLPAESAETWLQGDGDLGARLERILNRALRDSEHAIAIGADSPGMPRHLLDAGFAALQSADAVLGPAEDGGFYLLGLRICPPGLLSEVLWSRDDTCALTHAALLARGLKTVVLEPWFDIDRPDDLERLRVLVESGAIDAPMTASVLARAR